MRKKETRPVWPYMLFFAAGLVLAVFADLALNKAVYRPQNALAIFMESYGWYPVLLAPLALGMLVARQQKLLRCLLGCLLCAGQVLGALYISFGYLQKRGWAFFPKANNLFFVAALILMLFWMWLFWRADGAVLPALGLYAKWGTVLTVAELAVVNGVKLLWNRARFDEMLSAGGLGQFTPWYQPLANGGSSFPSGHTANAACVLALAFLCDALPAWQKRRRLVYTLCWGYIALMAATRVLIGRHFLSDTLAGATVTALLLYGIRRSKPYKKALGALRNNENEDGTN